MEFSYREVTWTLSLLLSIIALSFSIFNFQRTNKIQNKTRNSEVIEQLNELILKQQQILLKAAQLQHVYVLRKEEYSAESIADLNEVISVIESEKMQWDKVVSDIYINNTELSDSEVFNISRRAMEANLNAERLSFFVEQKELNLDPKIIYSRVDVHVTKNSNVSIFFDLSDLNLESTELKVRLCDDFKEFLTGIWFSYLKPLKVPAGSFGEKWLLKDITQNLEITSKKFKDVAAAGITSRTKLKLIIDENYKKKKSEDS